MQKREDDGEKTGEFETATEHDMSLFRICYFLFQEIVLLFLVSVFFSFFLFVGRCLVMKEKRERGPFVFMERPESGH